MRYMPVAQPSVGTSLTPSPLATEYRYAPSDTAITASPAVMSAGADRYSLRELVTSSTPTVTATRSANG
jgi:hypothetical protein